ncbi:HNH endonuclease signature motif containing protein [Nocardioides sp. OK12]|uniref:HNH endonuclease signature motif containing protein n=1 Tax=Nocardioides sp. OK12 TaxID=2758661 RepID=UPI0021C29104|nr:HNH endonuclease signature motif containing protein [Nocardioides sp. OK12]
MQTPLDDLSEAEVLARAGACATTARQAEVELLVIAYHWAVLHSADRLDPDRARLPGREQSRRYGGDGVAEVSEFAAAELGARVGLTPFSAARLIGDAQDLHHRHPALWARVQALEVRASYARHVVDRTRGLSRAEAAHVDAEVAEAADGRIPWTRFEALVAGKVAAAAPAIAREKEERARKARFAKTIGRPEHGMASFLIRADAATIARIDHAITQRAKTLEATLPDEPDDETSRSDDRSVTVDDRRVLAALQLAIGDDSLRGPEVTLVVHLDGRGQVELDEHGRPLEPIARVEGHGPVTSAWVRETLGPHARFTIRPVIDLAHQSPVDAYEIPARHRRAVRLLSPADTFPFGSCTSPHMQIDHTIPHGDGGPSRLGNYGPLTTSHHRLKTHGRWQVRQPFPGIHLWQDPHGATYLVDHAGTRQLHPDPAQAPPGRHRPTSTFEIYEPDLRIVIDPAA